MQWQNDQHIADQANAAGKPTIAETLRLLDSAGNVLATFSKNAAGVFSHDLPTSGAVDDAVQDAIDAVIAGASSSFDTLAEIEAGLALKLPILIGGYDDAVDFGGDALFYILDASNNTPKKISFSGLLSPLAAGLEISTYAKKAIVTPSSPTTGQTVSASTSLLDETLYITPAGTLLALTIELPPSSNARVGQIIRGFISQIITGLTVSVAGGGTAVGATPVTSAVNSTFAYQCVSVSGSGTWIRIQ